jgi:hypothetical protein
MSQHYNFICKLCKRIRLTQYIEISKLEICGECLYENREKPAEDIYVARDIPNPDEMYNLLSNLWDTMKSNLVMKECIYCNDNYYGETCNNCKGVK